MLSNKKYFEMEKTMLSNDTNIIMEIISGPTNKAVSVFFFCLIQWFSKCGMRTTSGTQRNLRIKYKSGCVSTKAIFF